MATLAVKVVPGASHDRLAGRYGDGVKVRVSAAPEKGKANAAVVALLCRLLDITPRDIELIAGHARARKLFRINGLNQQELASRLAAVLTDDDDDGST
jgi:uncharacterized protein YggU (UPF0235/DUF167 family)